MPRAVPWSMVVRSAASSHNLSDVISVGLLNLAPLDTKGAKEIGVHLFVLTMVDDCHSASEQQSFTGGLGELERFTRNRFGRAFMDSDRPSRERILVEITRSKAALSDLKQFYKLAKRRTIQGYLESEYFMAQVMPHKMIPDPYDGFYPASKYES